MIRWLGQPGDVVVFFERFSSIERSGIVAAVAPPVDSQGREIRRIFVETNQCDHSESFARALMLDAAGDVWVASVCRGCGHIEPAVWAEVTP